jgi:hypothetical protein
MYCILSPGRQKYKMSFAGADLTEIAGAARQFQDPPAMTNQSPGRH